MKAGDPPAAATGQTRRSGELNNDDRWLQFGPRASGLGVHSALSLPLVVSTGILGAMNIYAHDPNSFNEHSQNCGETFAVSAALVVQNAQILDQTSRLIKHCGPASKDAGSSIRQSECSAAEPVTRPVKPWIG